MFWVSVNYMASLRWYGRRHLNIPVAANPLNVNCLFIFGGSVIKNIHHNTQTQGTTQTPLSVFAWQQLGMSLVISFVKLIVLINALSSFAYRFVSVVNKCSSTCGLHGAKILCSDAFRLGCCTVIPCQPENLETPHVKHIEYSSVSLHSITETLILTEDK